MEILELRGVWWSDGWAGKCLLGMPVIFSGEAAKPVKQLTRFVSTESMAKARQDHTVTRLADGRVLASTEIYDPGAGCGR